jgi:hypothetical protein
MKTKKFPGRVTPGQVGVQNRMVKLDPSLRLNDLELGDRVPLESYLPDIISLNRPDPLLETLIFKLQGAGIHP